LIAFGFTISLFRDFSEPAVDEVLVDFQFRLTTSGIMGEAKHVRH
jgi:hypothetical protein